MQLLIIQPDLRYFSDLTVKMKYNERIYLVIGYSPYSIIEHSKTYYNTIKIRHLTGIHNMLLSSEKRKAEFGKFEGYIYL